MVIPSAPDLGRAVDSAVRILHASVSLHDELQTSPRKRDPEASNYMYCFEIPGSCVMSDHRTVATPHRPEGYIISFASFSFISGTERLAHPFSWSGGLPLSSDMAIFFREINSTTAYLWTKFPTGCNWHKSEHRQEQQRQSQPITRTKKEPLPCVSIIDSHSHYSEPQSHYPGSRPNSRFFHYHIKSKKRLPLKQTKSPPARITTDSPTDPAPASPPSLEQPRCQSPGSSRPPCPCPCPPLLPAAAES